MSTIQKIVKNADLWFSKFVIFTSEAKDHGPLEKLKLGLDNESDYRLNSSFTITS